jgi:UDPglucose 6-dehydrogenase
MKITIFGAGYVGLVTSACFADVGNHVVCVDINAEKVTQLNNGDCPIYEPGLPEMLARNLQAGRLQFTTDLPQAISHGDYLFIAVGTPQGEDGSADVSAVYAVAKCIGQHIESYRIVINKSTVPIGTAEAVRAIIQQELTIRGKAIEFSVASNPEFLREGAAIGDFINSDRIIIGTDNEKTASALKALYAPFDRNHERLMSLNIRSAEMAKYAANAFLATKISFINEMSHIAERFGADIDQVRIGIGSDPRIGYDFINPGCGYGGSCFPKDVSALESMAKQVLYEANLIKAVSQVNRAQKQVLFNKIKHYFKNDLKNKVIAIWGLAFKPNTGDMRDAPSRALMEALWQAGARVQVYDPFAMPEAKQIYGDRADLALSSDVLATLEGADALAIVTEWRCFLSPDFEMIKNKLRHPVIFDGRNLYDPSFLKSLGIDYFAIGRGESCSSFQNEIQLQKEKESIF